MTANVVFFEESEFITLLQPQFLNSECISVKKKKNNGFQWMVNENAGIVILTLDRLA